MASQDHIEIQTGLTCLHAIDGDIFALLLVAGALDCRDGAAGVRVQWRERRHFRLMSDLLARLRFPVGGARSFDACGGN